MSGVKHTPGPWTDKGGSAGAVWAGNEFIASVYPNAQPGWDGYGRFDRQDETEANARLIAAAPDLLETLVMMADAVDPLVSAPPIVGPITQRVRTALVEARAAIARARGEQSQSEKEVGNV